MQLFLQNICLSFVEDKSRLRNEIHNFLTIACACVCVRANEINNEITAPNARERRHVTHSYN